MSQSSASSIRGRFVWRWAAVFQPKHLLKLLVSPKLLRLVGQTRIEAIDRIINNNVIVKLRQRQCRKQIDTVDTATYLQTRFCAEPFRTLETTHTGLAFVCCPVWLPTPIGPLTEKPEALWNGKIAKDIRASIVDGSFRHCNHLHCPAITNRTLPSRDAPEAKAYIDTFRAGTPGLPNNVNLSHDKSCNLSCPSCRSSLYLANKAKQIELDALTDGFVLPLLRQAESVTITGSGDPFGSNHFRNVIKRLIPADYPKLQLNLITNGQLFDAKAWDDLKLKNRVGNVHISIDAATSDTYKIVRRGGTFERLLKNLAFIKQLRDESEIESLDFSMVVQSMNFREMAALVHLAEAYSADTVHFQMIRKRDIFSAAEYEEAFIGNPRHADYQEFLQVISSAALQTPRFQKRQVRIEMGNILAYVERQVA